VAAPVAAIGYLTYATVAPANTFWGPNLSRGRAGTNRVALTFDDGPTPGATDRVLDALRAASDVRAAFFVIGRNVEKHPDLLRRIHDEGHLIGNHSFSHSHYTIMRRWPYWEREMRKTDEAIERVLGVRPLLFRPPMGLKTWHTHIAARRCGRRVVTWSMRAIDGLPTTPQRILRRFQNLSDGDMLLLHDGVEPHAPHADRAATIEAVPELIALIRERGLTPVRLDELLEVQAYASTVTTA
jgi:peptidoglycan/xylan/chitin deacetylase (PgdA/CDA1 family)